MLATLGSRKDQSGSRILLTTGAAQSPLQRGPLTQALDRAVRAGRPATVLMVNLSRMHAPGPRLHHRRVCRAVIDLAAQTHAGQVFVCSNNDLVLLASPECGTDTLTLLQGMFRAEAPGCDELVSLWSVPGEEDAVRARLLSQGAAPASPTEDPPTPIGAMAALGALLASEPGGAFVRRQTAVRIAGGGVTPLFQELSFSLPALEAQIGLPIPAGADPYLFRHFAAQLDEQMLAALARGELASSRTLHLNLTLPGVRSAGFARLAAAAASNGQMRLGIELQFMEVVADLAGFAKAREVLREAGCAFVLDGVGYATLLLATPDALLPDWLKLDWSPRIAGLSARDRRLLRRTLEAVGPGKVVLQRAETEAALTWGMAQGIRCFQGRHVDAMLAADRLRVCAHAAGCTLRHCIDRGAATDAVGQVGCLNTALLDSAGGTADVAV